MTVLSLPEALPRAEQARIHAGILLLSGLAAQVALLIKLAAWESALITVVLLILLFIAIFSGVYLARYRLLQRKSSLQQICLGFIISAAGLILLLVTLHGVHTVWSLLPGIIISGLGQGMVSTAVMKKDKNKWHRFYASKRMATLLIIGVAVAVTAAVRLQSGFPGITGFPYAFALLVDIALFGALYVRIIELDDECLSS